MNETERKKLEEFYGMGKWNFIFVRGVLIFGSVSYLLFLFLMKYLLGMEVDMFMINFTLVLWVIGGFLWGYFVWNSIEKKLGKDKK